MTLPLTPDLLLRAYAVGVFPMAESADNPAIHWIDPEERGILPLDDFHLSKRLARTVRRDAYEIRQDSAFEAVIRACAEPVPDRPSTWINEGIVEIYLALFQAGYAHSVEAWYEGRLVGGLYGVRLGGAFFGESMFSRMTDASKVPLVHLVAGLVKGGFSLLDTQFTTPHLESFGARVILREEYHRRLSQAIGQEARLHLPFLGGGAEALGVLQASTQTS